MASYNSPAASRKGGRRAPMTGAVDPQARAGAWASYRETLNPLRGLTISRAVQLVESYPRGEFADLMWTFGAPFVGIECADADLSTIISRRCDALTEMDWNAQPGIRGRDDSALDQVLAEEQAAWLKDFAGGIGNLYEAVDHLTVAFHRGFAHLEMIEGPDGMVTELRPVDQWNVVRDGCKGAWKYNERATQTTYRSLPDSALMDPAWFVIREDKRPVGRISLIKFIRQNLTEKDWSAFLELYGTLSGVVIGPPDVPSENEDGYRVAAERVATGGSGYLPHGSEYKPNPATEGRTADVFEAHLKYLSEKLILVGTSGKLTMLAESGSGTLAGSAHADAFQQLARADARQVSEILQTQLFDRYLQRAFPGRPVSAYWELAFREEVDAGKVVEDAAKLSSAGYQMDPAELSQKTGYTLTLKSDPAKSATGEGTADPDGPNSQNAHRMHTPTGAPEGEDRGNGGKARTGDSVAISENPEKLTNRSADGAAGRVIDAAGNLAMTRAVVGPIGARLEALLDGGTPADLERLIADVPELVDAADLMRVVMNVTAEGLREVGTRSAERGMEEAGDDEEADR